jgi:hypothetical protein
MTRTRRWTVRNHQARRQPLRGQVVSGQSISLNGPSAQAYLASVLSLNNFLSGLVHSHRFLLEETDFFF